MGKYITRTITGKVVRSATIDVEDNEPHLRHNDNFLQTGRNAEKEAVKRYGQGTTVLSVEEFSETRRITTDNFMKYSEPVNAVDVSVMEG